MKAWYLTRNGFPKATYSLVRECHFICVQTPADIAAGNASTSGIHLGGLHFSGPSEKIAFEALPNITPLGHVNKNPPLPDDVADALEGYGVKRQDGLRDALEKVIGVCGVHTLGLNEI
jgi:hypothetical protein